MANSCYQRSYFELANTNPRSALLSIVFLDTLSSERLTFIKDTLPASSTIAIFQFEYLDKPCFRKRDLEYSDFQVMSRDVVCESSSIDRYYIFQKMKTVSRNKHLRIEIELKTYDSSVIFYQNVMAFEFFDPEKNLNWIII